MSPQGKIGWMLAELSAETTERVASAQVMAMTHEEFAADMERIRDDVQLCLGEIFEEIVEDDQ
jgi:hypothetical protein